MLKEDAAENTRGRIMRAAESVIRTKGVPRLTLSEVAAAAGVSKGGLLYHFPSKDALVEGMLSYAFDVFERAIERYRKNDNEPGAWLRGYILATFSKPGTEVHQESLTAAAIVASVSNNPELLAPYQRTFSRWESEMDSDGVDPAAARLIRFAVDGLWLQEALGLRPLVEMERARFIASLLEWTRGIARADYAHPTSKSKSGKDQ